MTQVRCKGPEGRSSLEDEEFSALIENEGFEPVFSCAGADCQTGKLRDNYLIGQQVDHIQRQFRRLPG